MNKNFKCNVLAVGEQYPDKQTNQCFVKLDYNIQWGLIAGMPNLTDSEVLDFESGELQIGVAEINSKLFILYKIGNQPWCDASYEPRLSPEPLEYPQIDDYSFCVELYDSATGILRVLRLFGLPNELSNHLHSRCTELAALGHMTRDTNERQVAQIYQKYENSTEMLKYVNKIYIIGEKTAGKLQNANTDP